MVDFVFKYHRDRSHFGSTYVITYVLFKGLGYTKSLLTSYVYCYSGEKQNMNGDIIEQAIEIATSGIKAVNESDLPRLTAETYAKFLDEMVKVGFSRKEAIEIICYNNPLKVSAK